MPIFCMIPAACPSTCLVAYVLPDPGPPENCRLRGTIAPGPGSESSAGRPLSPPGVGGSAALSSHIACWRAPIGCPCTGPWRGHLVQRATSSSSANSASPAVLAAAEITSATAGTECNRRCCRTNARQHRLDPFRRGQRPIRCKIPQLLQGRQLPLSTPESGACLRTHARDSRQRYRETLMGVSSGSRCSRPSITCTSETLQQPTHTNAK